MRVFWIVLDSVGIGKAPDGAAFGDEGSDTMKRCFDSGKLFVPHMKKLGLFNIDGMDYEEREEHPAGCFGRLCEKSVGKDTTIGHWEMAGLISEKPFPVYLEGFPEEIIRQFERETGRGTLCNRPYSGTAAIHDYGQEHQRTGRLIVYTSADSVFQIAAHEETIPVEELYEYCRIARKLLCGDHAVARVIARPFTGEYPDYVRTDRRHDFSLVPPRDTILDQLAKAGKEVIGVGKIYDIFAGKGITKTYPNHGNGQNMERTLEIQKEAFDGLCFVNLVDFDMKYGHRRDVEGYTEVLNAFDRQLGVFLSEMREEDILFITADHGCDPGYRGTDHTRETVPLLACGKLLRRGVNLGTRTTFADLAAAVGELFQVAYRGDGQSFLTLML